MSITPGPPDHFPMRDVEIFRLMDGLFRVDGGAMFGVVPRTLWGKKASPDSENRIPLALNCYLVRGPEGILLADSGVGHNVDRRFADFYALERGEGVLSALEGLGVHAEDVNFVFHSHLHFDHCGGATRKDGERGWRPTFPNARYIVQRGEWEQALNPVGRDRPSYIPGRLHCLQAADVLEPIEGEVPFAKGMTAVPTPGHTAFHQGLKVVSGGETFFYFGDTVPTAVHIELPYIMSFDLYPVETYDTKMTLLQKAFEETWTVAFSHDLRFPFGSIERINKKYKFSPIAPPSR